MGGRSVSNLTGFLACRSNQLDAYDFAIGVQVQDERLASRSCVRQLVTMIRLAFDKCKVTDLFCDGKLLAVGHGAGAAYDDLENLAVFLFA